MRTWSLLLVCLGLLACDSPARSPTPEASGGAPSAPVLAAVSTATPAAAVAPAAPGATPTVTTPATGAPPSASAKAGPRVIPPLDLACKGDSDCVIFDEELSGATACCPGCTWHAGNKDSVRNYHNACKASPAPMCPPIGCAMPTTEPKCTASKCVAAVVLR